MRPSESKHVLFGELPDFYCVHLSVNKKTGKGQFEIKDPAKPRGSRILCSGVNASIDVTLESISAWLKEHIQL